MSVGLGQTNSQVQFSVSKESLLIVVSAETCPTLRVPEFQISTLIANARAARAFSGLRSRAKAEQISWVLLLSAIVSTALAAC